MANQLRVSIVINTYNRARSLEITLRSLARLNYPAFEVIVVNGPSTDATSELLERYRSGIRVGTCSERNLSVSRNVGIEMARGDLVGFLDDDAVPDESWLNDIVAAFDAPDVGGVGGFVYDHTGYNLQYRYSLCDRLGTARWDVSFPGGVLCFPGTLQFPYLQGTNAVFRREALLEVGGYDEEFDYYLDETDLCLRLIDAGYLLRQIPNAFVYHRFLPSHIREATRVVTHWRSIIKNKVYFGLKNAAPCTSMRSLLEDWRKFVNEAEAGLRYHVEHGNASAAHLEQFARDADLALREGLERGLAGPRRFLHTDAAQALRGPVTCDALAASAVAAFKTYSTMLSAAEKLTVCYLSQEYPPGVVGGIGRLTRDLAGGMAERGHAVHVLTRGKTGVNTVDFEDGVWVHRLVEDLPEPPAPAGVVAPAHIWRYSARMLRELKRIQAAHPIHIVEAPVWDAEGLAAILDGGFRVVTSLHTPLRMALETNPDWITGNSAEKRFFDELAGAETLVIERAAGLRANSQAVVETLQRLYGVQFRPGQLAVLPHGMEARSHPLPAEPSAEKNGAVDVLFAGRFETRKGIDVLLQVIPRLCTRFPRVRFTLVGEDRPQSDGTSFTGRFETRYARASFRDRIVFAGKVSDAELEELLARCDIFVAPSRYESFGLVFLEAMMFAKPAVGCRAGGMKEVIDDGVTGILAEPGSASSLEAALASLIADTARRESMGRAGRKRFLASYTRDKLINRTLDFYRQVLDRPT